MSDKQIQLGLVGLSAAGSWATRSHLPYLKKTPHYEITALLNSSKQSAQKAAEKYELGSIGCYDDVKDLVSDPNVNTVAVSVKVPDHAAVIEPVLRAGKDIFVEWPLARNLEEAQRLVDLAQANHVKTLVGLQARQSPVIRKAKAMVESGELGQILSSSINATGIIGGGSLSESMAYTLDNDNGANIITIAAGHAMDAMCFVLGEFTDLQATLNNNFVEVALLDKEGKVSDTVKKTAHDYMAVSGHLQRGGVASVIYQGGSSDTGKNFYWEINGTKGSLVFEGDYGHVQMYQPRLSFVKHSEGADSDAKLEPVQADSTNESLAGGRQAGDVSYGTGFSHNVGQAWDAFVGVGEGHLTTFEDALLRHKMIDAIYRSDREGRRVSYC